MGGLIALGQGRASRACIPGVPVLLCGAKIGGASNPTTPLHTLSLEPFGPLLAELVHLGRDHRLAVALARVLRKVVLVVVLRSVELVQRDKLRDDRVLISGRFCRQDMLD